MNVLLVYPEFPPSYWGGHYALDFVGKRSSMPPLGLLTVAGMFPEGYNLRAVDMNVEPLTDEDLEWASVVLTSTMIVQRDSLDEVIARCNRVGVPIVAGGPHPTSYHDEIKGVDHFLLGEVEDIFPTFLSDLKNGVARPVYREEEKPAITKTPVPRYDLIKLDMYASMALQFSRGCPFDCEFCDITKLFGRVPRTKTNEQVIAELQSLYDLGWRGDLFLVDDNFIGNRRDALRVLPEIAAWQRERDYPFSVYTEASVNLAEHEPLMDAMVDAGFNMVFLGIETPNPEALLKTKKKQNTKTGQENYLLNAVRTIQHKGMQVTAGFILGLDGDRDNAFDAQIEFIQEAGIPAAMVGLLTALKGTDLYKRLQEEDRLLEESSGNNVSVSLNFVTEMDRDTLIAGYRRVLSTLYDPTLRNYFERCLVLLRNWHRKNQRPVQTGWTEILAFIRSLRRQLLSKQGPAYARFLLTVLKERPKMFPEAVTLAIMGYHFERITSQTLAVDDFRRYLQKEIEALRQAMAQVGSTRDRAVAHVDRYVREVRARVYAQYEHLHEGFRRSVEAEMDLFRQTVESL